MLCQEGAIPVLALLLQSSNYEVQVKHPLSLSLALKPNIAVFKPDQSIYVLQFFSGYLFRTIVWL